MQDHPVFDTDGGLDHAHEPTEPERASAALERDPGTAGRLAVLEPGNPERGRNLPSVDEADGNVGGQHQRQRTTALADAGRAVGYDRPEAEPSTAGTHMAAHVLPPP